MIDSLRFKNWGSRLKGFTLVELLIVLGLSVILTVSVFPIYGNLQGESQFRDITVQLVQNLRLARERSIGRLNNSAHGVAFFNDKYVLYQGSSYVLRDPELDLVVVFPNSITSNTNLSGGEVSFYLGTGLPNNFGSITISDNILGNKIIELNRLGVVDWQ